MPFPGGNFRAEKAWPEIIMGMIPLEIPEAQLVEWVQQLPLAAKQSVLRALIPRLDELGVLVDYGSQRVRVLCAERGLNWDELTEDERERLVDELLHEA